MSISIFELRRKLNRLSRIETEKVNLEQEYIDLNLSPIIKKQIEELELEYNRIGSEQIETVTYESDEY